MIDCYTAEDNSGSNFFNAYMIGCYLDISTEVHTFIIVEDWYYKISVSVILMTRLLMQTTFV